MDMNRPIIKIRDLGLSVALTSCGFGTPEIERNIGGQAYFVFIKTEELERAISDYWADTLSVMARRYSDTMKTFKSRLYSEQ